MTRRTIRNLYCITYMDNVPSIVRHGILSHGEIQRMGLAFTAIYDTDIVSRRSQISVPDGRTLWSFASLYFQPRNPMVYRVAIERGADQLAVVAVKTNVLARPDVMLANGNAAHRSTIIVPAPERDQFIKEIADIRNLTWWNAEGIYSGPSGSKASGGQRSSPVTKRPTGWSRRTMTLWP